MAAENVRVRLVLNDNFTGRLHAAAEAGRAMSNQWAIHEATWEPHDWSDWEA